MKSINSSRRERVWNKFILYRNCRLSMDRFLRRWVKLEAGDRISHCAKYKTAGREDPPFLPPPGFQSFMAKIPEFK